mmetsp:Transcript_27168/g.30059  ORF Transcript_27168/g.30059 Transcript_27168/m.30059 type:complete len:266 (+) Transcript_27168:2-799(+)
MLINSICSIYRMRRMYLLLLYAFSTKAVVASSSNTNENSPSASNTWSHYQQENEQIKNRSARGGMNNDDKSDGEWPSKEYSADQNHINQRDINQRFVGQIHRQQQQYIDSSLSASYNPMGSESRPPIDYEFQAHGYDDSRRKQERQQKEDEDISKFPKITKISSKDGDNDEKIRHRSYKYDTDYGPNPRHDAIAKYMSSFKGRLSLRSSCGLVGMVLGSFVGKSLLNTPWSMAVLLANLSYSASVFYMASREGQFWNTNTKALSP